MKTAWCQLWEESEAGWGCRSDGFSIHATKEKVAEYIHDYWSRQPVVGADIPKVPDEYSRPCGEPYTFLIPDEIYDAMFANMGIAKGIRFDTNEFLPEKNENWIEVLRVAADKKGREQNVGN